MYQIEKAHAIIIDIFDEDAVGEMVGTVKKGVILFLGLSVMVWVASMLLGTKESKISEAIMQFVAVMGVCVAVWLVVSLNNIARKMKE